jgi:hypothetical protein
VYIDLIPCSKHQLNSNQFVCNEQQVPALVFVEHSTAFSTSIFKGLSRAEAPDSSNTSAAAIAEKCMVYQN